MSTNIVGRVQLARVSEAPLSVETVLNAVADPTCGGLGLFVGSVRDHDPAGGPDDAVTGLDYSAHPSADAELAAACAEVADRYPEVRQLAVEHRIGFLRVGDIAVVVACAAPHRAPALAACAELIDVVKRRVPIWKEQHFDGGRSAWSGI